MRRIRWGPVSDLERRRRAIIKALQGFSGDGQAQPGSETRSNGHSNGRAPQFPQAPQTPQPALTDPRVGSGPRQVAKPNRPKTQPDPQRAARPAGAGADPRLVRLERDVADVRRHLAELSARLHAHARDVAVYPPDPAAANGSMLADAPESTPVSSGDTAASPPQPETPESGVAVTELPGLSELRELAAGSDEDAVPPVPPVEPPAPMRDKASRALFGY